MAPAYKLTYFPIRGLAEPIRFLLTYGDIDFEDERFAREDWPQVKESMPFGQVPVLEHNGKKANQSLAIARYVAKQVGLVGNDDWENLEIDAVVDSFNDMRLKIVPLFREEDQDKVKALKEELLKDTLPYYLTRFDALVKKNNGHLAVGRLTWADIYYASLSELLEVAVGTDLIAQYSNLAELREKVFAIPSIQKWRETRPKSDY